MYLYDYVDSFENDICKFYSSVKDESVSEKDYLHVINVWNTLKKENNGWLSWSLFKNKRFIISGYFWKVY